VRLLRDAEAGILLNEHVADDGPTVFGRACQRGADRVEEGRRRLPVWPAYYHAGVELIVERFALVPESWA
jgi:hypothetical protein